MTNPKYRCSDGTPYHFIAIPSSKPALQQKKLFIEFGPGGACFDHHTCAMTFPPYSDGWYVQSKLLNQMSRVVHGQDPHVLQKFPFAYIPPSDSPAHDWPYVNAVYCTSDLHLGASKHDYGDG